MRNRNVASRSALGRSERRETISTVGRTTGSTVDVSPIRVSSAHATSDHADRAVDGPSRARERVLAWRRVSRGRGDLGEHEPAPQVTLGPPEDAERRGRVQHGRGGLRAVRKRDEDLGARVRR